MKYKAIRALSFIGMPLCFTGVIYLIGNFAVSIYSFASQKNEVFNDITFNLIKQNNLTIKIVFSVSCFILSFAFLILFRINQIIKSWCEYNDLNIKDGLFYKKHPTALAKIKSMYHDNIDKQKSYARGEFKENNGIFIHHAKLEKYNVENRIERNVPLSNMLKDFILIDPFSKPYYRRDTFPNHRSLEEAMIALQEENEELERLRDD